jgi:hypothetical protein
MAIEGLKVNIPDELAGRTLVGQPRRASQKRRLDCRIERWPRLARRAAIPHRYKLFSLDSIAAKLALARSFSARSAAARARYPTLIEAHCERTFRFDLIRFGRNLRHVRKPPIRASKPGNPPPTTGPGTEATGKLRLSTANSVRG